MHCRGPRILQCSHAAAAAGDSSSGPCYRRGSFQTGTAMTDVAERRKRGQEKAGGWGETIRTVVYAVLIALVVRTFAIEPFNIP